LMKWQTARRCCWQFLLQQAEHEADLSEGPARVCQHDVVTGRAWHARRYGQAL
jgi:hypothetical protein